MGENEYRRALESAEKELAKTEGQLEVLGQRKAQLQQTIGALKTLMNVSEQEEHTLTDTIRIVVKAANGYISAANVLTGVLGMGARFGGKNALASVVSILSRLHKDGELEREQLVGGRYRWKGLRNAKTGQPSDFAELTQRISRQGTVLTGYEEHNKKK
jgi:hypothetical protein